MTVGSSMHCKRLWDMRVLITPPKGRPTKVGMGPPKVHTLVVDGPQSGAGSECSCLPATGLRRQKFLTAGHVGTIHESQQGLSSQIWMSPANTRSWGPSLKISAPGMRTAGQLCPPQGGRCVEGNGLILAKRCTSTITLGLMPSELHKVRYCEPDLPHCPGHPMVSRHISPKMKRQADRGKNSRGREIGTSNNDRILPV